ncbi:MAG: hypothetical protein HY897_19555 [Deltaproteobacteria bacterium]|nr:hypothetical protein [Deltaproteobacteria bacterium]
MGIAVDRFIEQQGYYGQKLRGGGGLIRIRHSLDKMVADGFVAIGEAANTVVPVHGSGVASAMLTGRLAAKAAAPALETGDTSTRALWPFAADYQRGRGRILAAFDVVRKMVDEIPGVDAGELFESGIIHRDDVLRGILVRTPGLDPRTLASRIPGMLRHPAMIPRIVRMGLTLKKVMAHYARYPMRYDPAAFGAWADEKRRLFGERAE